MEIIRKDEENEMIFANLEVGNVFETEKNELCLKVQENHFIFFVFSYYFHLFSLSFLFLNREQGFAPYMITLKRLM